jgi:hypothetical protein
VPVDVGGDPERDESGLPPVDIEVPDDARELDRDVHAYYRELRARRRRRRTERLIAPFTKHGMVIPLVAGMLAVTLFAGTMLTVITSAPETNLPRPIRSATPGPAPKPGRMGGLLPEAQVLVGSKPAELRKLRAPSVLAVVPRGCGCVTALRRLVTQAARKPIVIYFVTTGGSVNQLARLARRTGSRKVQLVEDSSNSLGVYKPLGLTAILVHRDGAVTEVDRQLTSGFHLEAKFQTLTSPGLGKANSPAPS